MRGQKHMRGKHHLSKFAIVVIIIVLVVVILGILFILGPLNIVPVALLTVLGALFIVLSVVVPIITWMFPSPFAKKEQETISADPDDQSVVLHTRSTVSVPPSARIELAIPSDSTTNQQHVHMSSDGQQTPSALPQVIFLFRAPLPDIREFYGRARERSILINRIRAKAATAVIGPRRIGKTWLLSYIRLITRSEFGPRYRIAYLDAMLPGSQTVAGFIAGALEALGSDVVAPDPTKLELRMLELLIENLRRRDEMPILCIDEFDRFANPREFDLSFFTGLRALAGKGLGLVTASKNPLRTIVGTGGITSGFPNIFEEILLKPFDASEADRFTREKSRQAGFTEEERGYLLKYGEVGKQQWPPSRLQLVGERLLTDKSLAVREDANYYRPGDPQYWRDFKIELDRAYQREEAE